MALHLQKTRWKLVNIHPTVLGSRPVYNLDTIFWVMNGYFGVHQGTRCLIREAINLVLSNKGNFSV